jgi:hypothetical protein
LLEHLLVPKQRESLETEAHWPQEIDLVADAKQLFMLLFPNLESAK